MRRSINGSLSLNKRDISIKQLSISLGIPFIMLSDSSLSVTNTNTFFNTYMLKKKKNYLQSASRSRLILDKVAYLNMVEKYSFTCHVKGWFGVRDIGNFTG